jgi:predicted MFS family arabinose efflux permease
VFRFEKASRQFARLALAQTFTNACVTGMRMVMPLQSLRDGQGATAVGCLIALFALAQVFLALPASRYCERHGLGRPIALSTGVATAGCLVAALWPVFPVLCVSALLTGGSAAVATLALQRHVPRVAHDPPALRRAFSWLAIGLALSNVLGPLVAGILIDAFGFRVTFVAMTTLPLLGWLVLRGAEKRVSVSADAAIGSGTAWDLLREPGLRQLLLVTCLLSCCWDFHAFFVPVLGNERALPAVVVGSILGAFGIGATAVRLLSPLVAAQLREWAVICGAMGAAGFLFGLYPLMPTPLAMGVCSALLGFSLGSTQPMVMSLLHQLAPPHGYGKAVAMRAIVINVSSVAMPMASGIAGSLIGVAGAFWLAALMISAGTSAAIGLRKH